MVTSAELAAESVPPEVWADPRNERLLTSANLVTAVRTVAAAVLAGLAAEHRSLALLLASLAVYWAGDVLDGQVARWRGCETRIGAAFDIVADRFCAAAFYVGLVWLRPELAPAVLLYLLEFMVVDCLLSLAFLAWPLRSPNYFYVVDRRLWLWNWSLRGKAANSAVFAVVLVATGWVTLGIAVAAGLLALKVASGVRLVRLGLPIPER